MQKLLLCYAAVTVDIMVSSKTEADLTSECTYNNPNGVYPYFCGKHLCKADPSAGHQNRRVNTQQKASCSAFAFSLAVRVISPKIETREKEPHGR